MRSPSKVAHKSTEKEQFVYTTISKAGMMYCHVLSVKGKAAEVPRCIQEALNTALPGRSSDVRTISSDGEDTDFVIAPPQSKSPPQKSPKRISEMPAMNVSQPSQPVALPQGRASSRSSGILVANSLSSMSASPNTSSSSLQDLAGPASFLIKFDALYLGIEPISTVEQDGVRRAMGRNEAHRKAAEVRPLSLLLF
jgi:hypothetical protein